jgi:hypothetical protein
MRSLILVALLIAIAGCGGRAADSGLQRGPLRDVFPPPSMDGAAEPAQSPASPAADGPAAAAANANPAVQQQAPVASAQGGNPAASAPSPATASSGAAQPAPRREELATQARLVVPKLEGASLGDLLGEDKPAEPEQQAMRSPSSAEPSPAADQLAMAPAVTPEQREAGEAARAIAESLPEGVAPRIVFSNRSAMLASIDGEPRYRKVSGSSLQRVVNTQAILFKSPSKFYLAVYDGFVEAPALSGPWTVVKSPTKALRQARAQALKGGQVNPLGGRPDPNTGKAPVLASPAPRVVVTTKPTALVVVAGDPIYEQVPDTQVYRLINADTPVYRYQGDGRTYVQLGQRWYSAGRPEGPWAPVAESGLPQGVAAVARGEKG